MYAGKHIGSHTGKLACRKISSYIHRQKVLEANIHSLRHAGNQAGAQANR